MYKNRIINGLAMAADVVTVNASNEAKLSANGDFFKVAGAAVTINRINTVTGVYYRGKDRIYSVVTKSGKRGCCRHKTG
ncbi:hypothetical protein ABIE26_000145 [Pedobacter africanus]|uniref:Uncharacterized protein n=1 Tax=Pedobacter africanus TaxID=151894 RepID=A0ACC6KW33_9SPHI|nr:hypothetical protein [Pedobacter africanus]MDR6783367.1 hypothetical protein [Pedobacter africanus]